MAPNGDWCSIHKQMFCLCQSARHSLVEMYPFTVMGKQFFFTRRDAYAVVFDSQMAPIPALSDLPRHISETQAVWLTGVYCAGYAAAEANGVAEKQG